MLSNKFGLRRPLFSFLLIASLSIVPALAQTQQERIEVGFRLMAGHSEVRCGKQTVPLGIGEVPSRLKDARLYIHDVRLLAADGSLHPLHLETNAWQYANLALLDFEDGSAGCDGDASLNAKVVGLAPKLVYTGIRFEIGAPVQGMVSGQAVSLNHSNVETAPAPLDVLAMSWNWQGGRKFVKLEFYPATGVQRESDKVKAWTWHLGSTGCQGNPARGDVVTCRQHNRRPVVINGFDPSRQILAFDVAALLARVDLSRDEGGAAGCMSAPDDPECKQINAWLDAEQERTKRGESSRLFRVIDGRGDIRR